MLEGVCVAGIINAGSSGTGAWVDVVRVAGVFDSDSSVLEDADLAGVSVTRVDVSVTRVDVVTVAGVSAA